MAATVPGHLHAEVCRSAKHSELVLDVDVIRNAEAFLDEVKGKYKLSVNNSYRPYDEQESLYRAWIAREKKGNPVARPGTSLHESGFAFDLNRLQTLTFHQWNSILSAGERYGFRYLLGDFPGEGAGRFDWPHFEADPIDFGMTRGEANVRNRVTSRDIKQCAWKPTQSEEGKAYLARAAVDSAHLTKSVNAQGVKLTYLNASLSNKGPAIVREIELRVELRDSLGGLNLIRLVHPVTAQTPSLQPGESRSVRALLGRVYDFWQDTLPVVRVTYVGL